MNRNDIILLPLKKADIPEFKREIQKAFQLGYEAEFGACDKQILPQKTIDASLSKSNAHACKAVQNGELIGGVIVVINETTQINELELFFIKSGNQGKGIGQAIWQAIEAKYPATKVWKTCTPYFEKRNIHFYVNRCGFHIVEFFNPMHKGPWNGETNNDSPNDPGMEYFFAFEKKMQ